MANHEKTVDAGMKDAMAPGAGPARPLSSQPSVQGPPAGSVLVWVPKAAALPEGCRPAFGMKSLIQDPDAQEGAVVRPLPLAQQDQSAQTMEPKSAVKNTPQMPLNPWQDRKPLANQRWNLEPMKIGC